MKLKQLRDKQLEFLNIFDPESVNSIRSRLSLFYEDFSIDRIKNMQKEDYVYGRFDLDKKKTFCYWMEKGLWDFGRISGSPCSQYGVWYGTHGEDREVKYRNTKRYGISPEDALERLKGLIAGLYQLGLNRDYSGIARHMIANKFKGKILATYFPDVYLSIYADDYLNDILRYFNLDDTQSTWENPIYQQQRLINWKKEDQIMKNWDLPKFAMFINHELTQYYLDRDNPNQTQETAPSFEDLGEIHPQEIIFNIDKQFEVTQTHLTKAYTKVKPDYVKKTVRNMAIGTRGEQIVFNFEQTKFKGHKKFEEIKWLSKNSDGYGYDVVSIEADGTLKQIEVKTTEKSFNGIAGFYLTEFERSIACSLSNYYIYYVTDILTKTPCIYVIKAPFADESCGIALSPTAYWVEAKSLE